MMEVGFTLFILVILIAAIWIIIELKRMKHKLFAVFLIALILFSYLSASIIFKGKDIDFKSISGLTEAGKIYLSWIGSVFANFKSITTHAIDMDWRDENIEESSKEK